MVVLLLGWFWLGSWWIRTAWAGQPDYPNQMAQQYIGDVVQTVQEQSIPKGDLIKQLVLGLIEDMGWTKALLWMAAFPLLGMVGVVWGAMKFFQRKA